MNRRTRAIILAFSGLTLLLSVAAAAFDWKVALGAAAVAGSCAVWAALMSTSESETPSILAEAPPEFVPAAATPPQASQDFASAEPSVVVVVQPASAPVEGLATTTPERASNPVAQQVQRAEPVSEPRAQHDATPEAARLAAIEAGVAAVAPTDEPELQLTMPESVEPCDVAEALLANARAAGDAVRACLWMADIGTPTLRLVCAVGVGPEEPTPVPIDKGVLGVALSTGAIHCDRHKTGQQGDASSRWRFAVPISVGEPLGVAAVDFAGEAEPDTSVMERVSNVLRGALSGALALHVSRGEAASARELIETVTDLSRLLDPDEVVSAGLEHALRVSGADTGSVMLIEDGATTMHIAEAYGLPEDVVRDTVVSEGEGIAGWVLASGRPLVVEDLEHKGPQSRRHGVLSAASVPIADDDGVLGVLNVGSRSFQPRFSRSHVRAIETVGRAMALALRNARAAQTSQDLFFDSLKALALALETRDPYSNGSTARVVSLSVALGDALGLDEADAHALKLAALLHDIGMSAAGDAVAIANRPLTTVEWGMLKMHPRVASDVLAEAPALRAVIPIVYHHHEHFDGTGYASGVAGEEIPIGARILAVADAYVAMTSARPYRPAMSREQAVRELTEHAGTQFDPTVVGALFDLVTAEPDCFAVQAG